MESDFGIVLLAMFAGAIRVSTPFLFVSLGECLTEKSGRINLGLEGTLVFGAMTAYAISYQTGSPWLGVLVAGFAGSLFGALHGYICKLPKVNDIAIGIALMLFGTGLAFFFGKAYIQPQAPRLSSIDLGWWSDNPQVQSALQVNPLFLVGIALAVTVALSLYLAGAITGPVRRLAAAADAVRRGQGHADEIPDFTNRHDEIGDLSGSLRDMTDALWQRMVANESFAADVAHEIKNPLTSLRSAVETAARVRDPEQQATLMAIIQDDVKRLDRLISDISDASRLDAELARGQMEKVDLGRVLPALVQVHQATGCEDGQPRLTFRGGDSGDCIVMGIEGRLVQVFQNLITNAKSFTPPGGEIVLSVRRDRADVVVWVEDQGPGIPAANLDSIFERFYSERPEGESFGRHSGLGLSISRQIVEAHQGRIHAENIDGPDGRRAGARFVVRLPAAD